MHTEIIKMKRTPSFRRQRGITLLIGLVFLILLTVVGLVGYRNTTMAERMTGNTVDRNLALQAAESAGKEALQVIEGGSFNTATTGHYGTPGLAQGGTTSFWNQGDGASTGACTTTTPFRWNGCAAEVATKYASNNSKAKYVIELLSQVNDGTSTTYSYRVTTRSTGGSGDADVVLQIDYVKVTTP